MIFKQENIFKNYKEGIRFLKYIQSFNGNYCEYICRQDDIRILSKACKLFIKVEYKTTSKVRESIEIFVQVVRDDIENISNPLISSIEEQNILSNPQIRQRILTLLVDVVLPFLVSLTKDE